MNVIPVGDPEIQPGCPMTRETCGPSTFSLVLTGLSGGSPGPPWIRCSRSINLLISYRP